MKRTTFALPVLLAAAWLVATAQTGPAPQAVPPGKDNALFGPAGSARIRGERVVLATPAGPAALEALDRPYAVRSAAALAGLRRRVAEWRRRAGLVLVRVKAGPAGKAPLLVRVLETLHQQAVRFVLDATGQADEAVLVIPYGQQLKGTARTAATSATSAPSVSVDILQPSTRRSAASAGSGLVEVPIPASATAPASRPTVTFVKTETAADEIVYVVDRSESMKDANKFEWVCTELLRSIGALQPSQRFHVVFFSDGPPKENPPRRLVPATLENKVRAARYLAGITPAGQTEPVPALFRAFEVLSGKSNARTGQVIYLLTDGDFTRPKPRERLLTIIRRLNPWKKVVVNTIFYGKRENPKLAALLKRIAKDNGGKYTYQPTR